jgi:hypothetical protein
MLVAMEPHRAVREAKETTVYLTHQIKAGATTLALGFLLAFAFATAAQAGNGVPTGMTASEWKALQARSQAMNKQYAPLRALAIRSEALNRTYGLGGNVSGGTPAQALNAIKARSEALNQRYQLGRYAVVRVSNGFDWGDAGIGAGAMLGVILVAGGLGILVRRSRDLRGTSFPSTT